MLLRYIRSTFALASKREKTGILGASTGWRGAIIVASLYSKDFTAASGLSGLYDKVTQPKNGLIADIYGDSAHAFLRDFFLKEGELRWIEYSPICEETFIDMSRTLDRKAQEGKIKEMTKYIFDQRYLLSVYSPLTLYAVNKEVDFVPQKRIWLRLKETSVTDRHWSVRGK